MVYCLRRVNAKFPSGILRDFYRAGTSGGWLGERERKREVARGTTKGSFLPRIILWFLFDCAVTIYPAN